MIGHKLNLKSIEDAKNRKNSWTLEKWSDGNSYLTGYSMESGYKNYNGLGWIILARQPIEAAYSSINEIKIYTITFCILSSILFAFIGWFNAGIVVKPLKKISEAANMLQTGQKVEIPNIEGIKEIEMLSSSIKNLVISLTNTETALGEMENLAYHDKLTNLPNRIALDYYLIKALPQAEAENFALTFLCLDLDGFKLVNDTYGHATGDILLQEVAVRLKTIIQADEIVARLGGDEFVMIIKTAVDAPTKKAALIADKIIKEISLPYLIENQEIKVGCSIGGASWPIDSTEPIEIMRLADQALYKSKRDGKNRFSYID